MNTRWVRDQVLSKPFTCPQAPWPISTLSDGQKHLSIPDGSDNKFTSDIAGIDIPAMNFEVDTTPNPLKVL